MRTRAVFVDRDGAINEKPVEGSYVTQWDEFHFLPSVPDAVRILNENGFLVIVITNQRGVALGHLSQASLDDIHMRMTSELQEQDAFIDAVYFCPHEENSCECRKPALGMFLKAIERWPDINVSNSFVVGDSWRDMAAARGLGTRAIFVGSAAQLAAHEGDADAYVASLFDAVVCHISPQ